MGLVSYFRNLYYENRLKKADNLLNDGRTSEAESFYLYLLDKHPLAASRLAEYYMSLSSEKYVKNDIVLFKKVVDLKSNSGGVCDITSYEAILKKHIEYIADRANSCFSAGRFDDCLSLTSVLRETRNAGNEINILHSEAKIRLLYNDIDSVKGTNNNSKSLVEAFKSEWYVCKGASRAKDSALRFCKHLEESKRYFASIQLLSTIYDNPYVDNCLDNAVRIIYGHDSEASPDNIKSIVSSYGHYVILRKGITNEAAVSLFDACWNKSGDVKVVMDVLNLVEDEILKEALVNNIFANHSNYLISAPLFTDFTKWLNGAFDDSKSLKLFEKLHDFGYNVEREYTAKVHDLTSKMPFEDRIPYLDYAQGLFPNSTVIIEDKLACAQKYLEREENDNAIKVSDTILGKSEKAYFVKSRALCNLANKEKSVDKKLEFLNLSQTALSSYKGSDSITVKAQIEKGLIHAANQLYESNDSERAYSILTELATNGSEEAISEIVRYRLKETQSIVSSEEKYKCSTEAINEIRSFGVKTVAKDTNFLSLWDERINSLIVNSKKFDNKSAVDIYEAVLKEIASSGFDSNVQKIKYASIVKYLVERKYLIARELELAGDLEAASQLYKEINILEAKRTPTLSALRFILCKLKTQNVSDVLEHRDNIYTLLRKAAAAYKSEKDDIAYRFALLLLKAGEDKEASDVLSEFLPNEEHLKKACEQGAVIKAMAKIDDFNAKLASVKDKTLSSNDAVFFINHMLEYAELIKPILELPRPILSKYRNKLKNYAIFKLFDEERYDIAFEKLVKEHKDYLDDYTALRNIALVCLNMAETKQITATNYQDVISIWLTAIYQEKLFVKSLDYTSWDDPFTFSLYEAYGHFDEDSIGALPDNVTLDFSDEDSVVLIKEVQRALLDRFEAAISENRQFHEFFTFQKDAMDSFTALNLDEKCRLVAPYLAHKDEDLFQDLSDALEHDREQEYDNWEDLLSVGAVYQMPQSIYTDYDKAKTYYKECVLVIDAVNDNSVKQTFLSSKVMLIKRFPKLFSALISYSNSKISALSAKNKTGFKNNYNFYLSVCSSLKDNTLSFMFSNYVMQYVVGEVNGQSMRKPEAARYILSILSLDKNNSKVRENLTALFEMLARENTSDSTRAVTNILDRVKNIDVSLYNQLNREYEQARIDKELNEIVDKVNNGSMNHSTALDKVYSMYSKNPNSSRICENLAQLCTMCIMEYVIGNQYGSSSVERILDKLSSNKSSEFRKQGSSFRSAYNSIWNKLPYNTRTLLEGGINAAVLGQTLNENGLALRKGLNYFKSLGGFSSGSSSLFPNLDFLDSIDDNEYPF